LDPSAFVALTEELCTFTSLLPQLHHLADIPVTVLVGEQDDEFQTPARSLLVAIPGRGSRSSPARGTAPRKTDRRTGWSRSVATSVERSFARPRSAS
jgi:hypothetical protein